MYYIVCNTCNYNYDTRPICMIVCEQLELDLQLENDHLIRNFKFENL